MFVPARERVLIPSTRWTPIRNTVFDHILPALKEKRAALVYLVLYDRTWHGSNHRIHATIADLARWTGLDERTISDCLDELEQKGFVVRVSTGVRRSRISKPLWRVPAAEFRLSEGSWVPIPRLLIKRYLPAYANAVLAVVLVKYQHLSWKNYCWPTLPTLGAAMGWSTSRVAEALNIMGRPEEWKQQRTCLPRPIELISDRQRRVRALWYGPGGPQQGTVRVSRLFRERFDVPLLKPRHKHTSSES